jgi:3-methyl-2-oxobutanoate hydroxymethyltransferase
MSRLTPDPTPASPYKQLPRRTLGAFIRHAMTPQASPFAMLTCYDATTARWLTRAGIPMLLVGDTAAEMVLGFKRTLDMPLDVLLALTAGVKRGSEHAALVDASGQTLPALVMGDMPFGSYHASLDDAVLNAGRFLTEGLADIVKLEVDAASAPLVERLTRTGIPVCAHIGSRPQHIAMTGTYKAAGRTQDAAHKLLEDARVLQEAGALMLLIEAVPDQVAEQITRESKVPVIGIGAGPSPHGQVLVLQDLLGLSDEQPAFGKPATDLATPLKSAAQAWIKQVASRQTPPSPIKPTST